MHLCLNKRLCLAEIGGWAIPAFIGVEIHSVWTCSAQTSTVKNWFCDSPACRTALLSHQSSTGSRNDLSGAIAASKHCDKESAKRVTGRGVKGMKVWLEECGGSRWVWLRNNLGIRGEFWCRNWDLQTTATGRVWMTSESMVEDSPKWSFAASEIQKFYFGNWAFSSFFEWKLRKQFLSKSAESFGWLRKTTLWTPRQSLFFLLLGGLHTAFWWAELMHC